MPSYADLRKDYTLAGLAEKDLARDPFRQFEKWFAEAQAAKVPEPNAMVLASCTADGRPSTRTVLLKALDGRGFVFYTNYESRKAEEIEATGKAAFVLHWKSLRRQIRVRGVTEREEGPQADAYYASRSLKSRLGAWASRQSEPLSSRAALMAEVAKVTIEQGPIPRRPPFWGGIRIRPTEIEFWADGQFRLHDRFRWSRNDNDAPWEIARLNP